MFLGFINVFPNNKSGLENKINPYGSIKKKFYKFKNINFQIHVQNWNFLENELGDW